MKYPILRFLCVIAAHYRTYEGQEDLGQEIIRIVRRELKIPPDEIIPDTVWPIWGRGVISTCPDCDVKFLRQLDCDSPCCYRCATDRIHPNAWSSAKDGHISITLKSEEVT